MPMKINFDKAHNPETPTFILAKKSGDKIGLVNAKAIEITDALNDASEFTFTVDKYENGKKDSIWDYITNFKLVYCIEWDMWFEIRVEIDESAEVKKTVYGTSLGQAELSQIMLYNIEINTEDDIARDDYKTPTVLYNPDDPSSSLLHRILEKAPHYSIGHVDSTIDRIQRMFSFDDTSIYDALQDIAEEINCLFVINAKSSDTENVYLDSSEEDRLLDSKTRELLVERDHLGYIRRIISVYDLESNCNDCGNRGEFTGVCPKCGSTDINEGYGDDTTIFITADELAEDIQLTTDTDEVKNCFKLEAGDDLMTASVRNCNPNGSDYIWNITDAVKADMSSNLVAKIESYDKQYAYYQNEYISINSDNDIVVNYNNLVKKYRSMNDALQEIDTPIKGYPALMNAYYNTIDMELYLRSSLMPTVKIDKADAESEVRKLTEKNLSPVSAESIKNISNATADSIVLSMAKVIVDSSRFRIKVHSSTLNKEVDHCVWVGSFDITNYSDEDDSGTSGEVTIIINDNYEAFVKQKIDKALAKGNSDDMSITGLFKKELTDFKTELKKYSLNRLTSFFDACQTCIDILIEQGIADKETWSGGDPNLYDDLYVPYLDKLSAVTDEIAVREAEINTVVGIYDNDGTLLTHGLQSYIKKDVADIQNALDFQDYLGNRLWMEFCSFRREDKYSNDNYISDGLDNAQLFKKALEFINVANEEIHKASEFQHSISANLNNLLAIKKFEPIVGDFKVGNWLRIQIDDEIYKLRLIEYSIDYDDISSMSVEFSDTTRVKDSVTDIKSVLDQASSMATSYSYVKRQAKQGNTSRNQINDWFENGLSMSDIKLVSGTDNQSVSWDKHGILCREYIYDNETYGDEQLKIINNGLYTTNDNWQTSRAAIGKFSYYNPKTKNVEQGYGVIADTLIGALMLTKELGIYSENGDVAINGDGIAITASSGDRNPFVIKDPQGNELVYVNSDGNLVLSKGRVVFGSASDDGDTSIEEISLEVKSAVSTANDALKTANGIDAKATSAVNTAKAAESKIGTINIAATATLASGKTQTLTSTSTALPLASIVKRGNYSAYSNGIKVPYAGLYEVSGYVNATGLSSGKDLGIRILNGSDVVREAVSTSAGSNITVSIPSSVVKLSADQVLYLAAYTTGSGTVSGSSNAALNVKFLGDS